MGTREEMIAGTLPAEMPTLTAERLVEEAQAFSQEAWAQIYDQHYMKIFSYCYLRTGNRAASEDLASDVFLEALRGIRRYRYRGLPISSWLYRIAHNLTADYLRRNARRPTVSLGDETEHAQLQAPDTTERSALRQDVHDAIRQLTLGSTAFGGQFWLLDVGVELLLLVGLAVLFLILARYALAYLETLAKREGTLTSRHQ